MVTIALILNFSRCTFIDVFVGMTFFGNIYVWRIFNVFLMMQLNIYLIISIIIDLCWEIMRVVHYSSKYELGMKKMRLVGLILSFINIVIKIILAILYYRLSMEDQKGKYLDIEKDNSIHMVDNKDYITKSVLVEDHKKNTLK